MKDDSILRWTWNDQVGRQRNEDIHEDIWGVCLRAILCNQT